MFHKIFENIFQQLCFPEQNFGMSSNPAPGVIVTTFCIRLLENTIFSNYFREVQWFFNIFDQKSLKRYYNKRKCTSTSVQIGPNLSNSESALRDHKVLPEVRNNHFRQGIFSVIKSEKNVNMFHKILDNIFQQLCFPK